MSALRKILLATDLSARSDRAMDRASQLAAEHDAELLALHVLEPVEDPASAPRTSVWAPFERYTSDRGRINAKLVTIARRELAAGLGAVAERLKILIEDGDAAEVILRVARDSASDLVVMGVARNESLGRFSAGKTVDRVLKKAETAVLVVNDRVMGPYGKVAVAVDFSPGSRAALHQALALFPRQHLLVLHAYDIPYASFVGGYAETGTVRTAALAETEAFVAAVVARDECARLNVVVERGEPAVILRELGRMGQIDLVVLGSNARGAVLNALLGSVARRIVGALPCDALVVREAQG